MRAYRMHAWHEGARLEDVPVPEPGPGQVLLRIGGAGACHSDLHLMRDWDPGLMPMLERAPLPFTLGHENAGWIAGGDAGSLPEGAPVVVSPTWSCGRCRSCRRGETHQCEDESASLGGGLGLDGGLADYMLAPGHCLIPLRGLEPWQAAPLSDAGLTSYHAVKRCLPVLAPDTTALVIGVGGLGHLAVAFLRVLTGAQVVAADVDPQALEVAARQGADLCLASDAHTAERVREATRGRGAHAVLDFVGAEATLQTAVGSAARGGQIAVVGIGGGTIPMGFGAVPPGVGVVCTLGGSTSELEEVVALVESGRVRPAITRFPLGEVDAVYEKLHRGEIAGRAVLVP